VWKHSAKAANTKHHLDISMREWHALLASHLPANAIPFTCNEFTHELTNFFVYHSASDPSFKLKSLMYTTPYFEEVGFVHYFTVVMEIRVTVQPYRY
jgi:hypothetical protein